jgi:hypothetical protein
LGLRRSGKSVLAAQAVDHALRLEAQVLRGDGTAFKADLAFGGLDLLLRLLEGRIAEHGAQRRHCATPWTKLTSAWRSA